MTRDKRLVARQFSRAAASYDAAAAVQQYALQQLLALLPQRLQGHWLDIGCGTGAAVAPLLEKGTRQLTGIDMAAGMLQQAQHKYHNPQLHWLQADADQLPLASDCAAGIVSSLMLQWSENPAATLREWQRVLQPGGCIAVASLLPGTHQEMQQAWHAIDQRPHVNRFSSQADICQAIDAAGLVLTQQQQQCFTQQFADMSTLLRSLKAIGATNVNPGRASGLGGRKALQQLQHHYPKDAQDQYPLSYQLHWWLAHKPDE
jgi:malonyl-CoA O-methyltransferase